MLVYVICNVGMNVPTAFEVMAAVAQSLPFWLLIQLVPLFCASPQILAVHAAAPFSFASRPMILVEVVVVRRRRELVQMFLAVVHHVNLATFGLNVVLPSCPLLQ